MPGPLLVRIRNRCDSRFPCANPRCRKAVTWSGKAGRPPRFCCVNCRVMTAQRRRRLQQDRAALQAEADRLRADGMPTGDVDSLLALVRWNLARYTEGSASEPQRHHRDAVAPA